MGCWTTCKHLSRSQISFRYWSRKRRVLNNLLLLMGMITVVEAMSWRCWDTSVWWVCYEFIVFWVITKLGWSACFLLTLVNKVFIPVWLEVISQPYIIMVLPILCWGGMFVLLCLPWALKCIVLRIFFCFYWSFFFLISIFSAFFFFNW